MRDNERGFMEIELETPGYVDKEERLKINKSS